MDVHTLQSLQQDGHLDPSYIVTKLRIMGNGNILFYWQSFRYFLSAYDLSSASTKKQAIDAESHVEVISNRRDMVREQSRDTR